MNPDIINFIEAHRRVKELEYQLFRAKGKQHAMAKALTNATSQEGHDIPETFAIQYNDCTYLIRIDVEGDHGHRIEEIGAILS